MADAPFGPGAHQGPPGNMAAQAQQMEATKKLAATTMAAAIITVSKRPHSVKDAMNVLEDVYFAMWPAPGHGRYEAWKKDPAGLEKVHE